MTPYRLAIPTSLLLLSLTVSSAGQTNDDARETSGFALRMQAPAQAVAPITPSATRQLTAEDLADLMMARKDYREAGFAYKKLCDEDPRNAVYLNKLGIALHQQTELGAALKSYERAVKVNPQYADAQNNIGTIWYQRKKFGRAIRAYQKAIKLRTDMAVLYSNLGYAYFGDKKYDESIASFQQAMRLDPNIFEHNSSRSGSILQDRSVNDRARFYFLLAKSFAETGNFDRSMVYLRKAKDEGYASMGEIKTDPAFSAMLNLPEMQEVLAPKAVDATH